MTEQTSVSMGCEAVQSRPGRAVTRSSKKPALVDLNQALDEPEVQPGPRPVRERSLLPPGSFLLSVPNFLHAARLQAGEHLQNCSTMTAS
jgi:hypothetical protein